MGNLENMIRKRKGLIIAIDFDGTIVEHEFPKIGVLLPNAKGVIRKLKKDGHKIIIWTCRNHTEEVKGWNKIATIRAVQNFLDANKIPYNTINENVPSLGFWLESRKVYADIYIDDKNLGGFCGWIEAYRMIQEYLKTGKWIK